MQRVQLYKRRSGAEIYVNLYLINFVFVFVWAELRQLGAFSAETISGNLDDSIGIIGSGQPPSASTRARWNRLEQPELTSQTAARRWGMRGPREAFVRVRGMRVCGYLPRPSVL